ncbi:hypothetical protein [Halalkalicoccus ordinarius]|uniref:hypothetical protein n=1 Tax=Halalkalicoccus ordinarius TaxID=3116651 RepID=UPI00300EE7BB
MGFREDDLTNGLIRHYEAKDVVDILEPEASYRNSGRRGVPDLYVVFYQPGEALIEAHLIEVKSEHAVRSVTGANAIIRQFNKMRRYFYSSNERGPPTPEFEFDEVMLFFELAFIPSEYNFTHLLKNAPMYNHGIQTDCGESSWLPAAHSQDSEGALHNGVEVQLTLRHPKAPTRSMVLVSASGRSLNPGMSLPPSPNSIKNLSRIDTHLYNKLMIILKNYES